MKKRAEAIEHLKRQGLHAEERDWALGETVVVATEASEENGITALSRPIYIRP